MRDLGGTAIVLGLLAGAASWITPESWELGRWATALLMLGAPIYMAHLWFEQRRERLNTQMPHDHVPPADPRDS